MHPLFRTGQLVANADFLTTVPRSAMIQAIVRHVTEARQIHRGEPIFSQHQHGPHRFHLLTMEDRTKTLIRLDDGTHRLGCISCDRQEFDGITAEELEQAKADGWRDIESFQSLEDSMRTYDNPNDAPPSFDVTAWYTCLGECPDCQNE
jgi:hypothetical protein